MDSKFQPQALIFDLMGTCCDWNSSILAALKECPPEPLGKHDFPKLAADWRLEFFKEIHRRFQAGLPAEDIDITHRRILDNLLDARNMGSSVWDDRVRNKLVAQWHNQKGNYALPHQSFAE
jgi:hypothetical protein